MGFTPKRKIYRLKFADPEMEGLEVRARSAPVGALLGLVKLADLETREIAADDLGSISALFEAFAEALIDWNLEDEVGQLIPPTLEGLYSQDQEFALDIVLAWVNAIASVPAPLARPSPDGGLSLAASIPMVPLSQNQAS